MRTPSIIQNRKSNGSNISSQDIQVHYAADRSSVHSNPGHSLNLTQQQINAALFNSNSPVYSAQPIIGEDGKHYQNQELHMAEILVQSANGHQRSAFQFDTITPKKPTSADEASKLNSETDASSDSTDPSSTSHDDEENTEDTKEIVEETTETNAEEKSADVDSSSDDSGGFKTPEEIDGVCKRMKRNTVVGNPMFSRSQDSDLGGPRASLGIDDLEMDYEQIMSYFDNLKV